MPQSRRREQLQPPSWVMESNERAAVWVGTAIWALLLVAAVLRRDQLAAAGHSWWLWTPLYGIALGLLGIRWLSRQGR